MRKHFAVVTLLLLFAVSAVAQERTANVKKGSFRIFAFSANFGYTESDVSGSNWNGDYGLGLEYQLSDRWSTEISVSREQTPTATIGTVNPDGSFSSSYTHLEVHPVDVVGEYHFFTASAWKPFIGVGLRYVDASRNRYVPFVGGETRLSPQVTAGFYYQFTRHFGLRLDGKRLLRNDSTWYDDAHKLSVGLGWKF
jgi:outer membrane protein W